jgi:hypothetical protein
MALNKKQKKQLDVARKKITKLQQLLAAAKQQPDDPSEPDRIQAQIAEVEREIEKLKAG